MSETFQIQFRKSNGNLHLRLEGDFNGSSAWQLIRLLEERYCGKGRIFIDTRHLKRLHPFGCSTFQSELVLSRVPAGCLFFKGEKGFEIAPRKSNVIMMPQKSQRRCSGDCKNCSCGSGKKYDFSTEKSHNLK